MKLKLTFTIDENRSFDHAELMDEMAGAMSEFEAFEGAGVECVKLTEKASLSALRSQVKG